MFVIAGLGNPEKKYDHTRHNTGYEAMDCLAEKFHVSMQEESMKALIGKGMIGTEKVIFVKPLTYMNLSGEALQEILHFYKVPVENLLVLCDDVYLDLGVLRIRRCGSAGGHNGLKNIIALLGSENFKRIRIGVGKIPEKMDLVHYVLSHFTAEEEKTMKKSYQIAAEAVETILTGDIDRAMNLYNGPVKE